MQGDKVIEITNTDVNKSNAGARWVSKNKHDFIMAIGDGWTDEFLFKTLPETAYSIRVGLTQSYAKFNLRNNREVLDLLKLIIKIKKSK